MTGSHTRWVRSEADAGDLERIAIREALAFGKAVYDRRVALAAWRPPSTPTSASPPATTSAPSASKPTPPDHLTTHFIAAPRVMALDKALANKGVATRTATRTAVRSGDRVRGLGVTVAAKHSLVAARWSFANPGARDWSGLHLARCVRKVEYFPSCRR
jgi:hypothetical protein